MRWTGKAARWLTALLLCGMHISGAAAADNLLLAAADADGVPEGKKIPAGATARVADGGLDITYTQSGSLSYGIHITPDHRCLLLTGEMETKDLEKGDADWKNGRLAMRFIKQGGKMAGAWPAVYAASGTTATPIVMSRVYNVPPDATMLLVEPSHFGVSGSVTFRKMVLREAPENLLLAPNPGGIPVEGFHQGAITATVADGALSMVIDQTGSHRMSIPVAANWKSLKLSFRWKTENVRRGDADWKDARIALRFYDAKGGVGPWPNNFTQSGTSDWKTAERVYEIPEGATSLAFEPANFGAEGVVRFENLSLTLETLR